MRITNNMLSTFLLRNNFHNSISKLAEKQKQVSSVVAHKPNKTSSRVDPRMNPANRLNQSAYTKPNYNFSKLDWSVETNRAEYMLSDFARDDIEKQYKDSDSRLPMISINDMIHYLPPILKKAQQNCNEVLLNYFEGKVSQDDVKECFKQLCDTVLDVNIANGRTTGDDPADNEEILNSSYWYFHRELIGAVVITNKNEGAEIAKQQGGFRSEQNWFYYNADYYYLEKDLTNIIGDFAKEVGQEMGIDGADPRQYCKNHFGEYDFNFTWNGDKYEYLPSGNGTCSGYGWNTGKMINTKLVPPKDFTFFFGEGVSETDIKNGLIYKRVMIVNQVTVSESSVNNRQQTNAFDFWGENNGAGVFDFLKNFELFNRDPWGGTSILDYMNFDKNDSFLNALC